MKKLSFLFAMMALMTITAACRHSSISNHDEEKELEAKIGSFDRIRIQTACELTFEIGESAKVTMSGDASLVDHVILDKQDGCLIIKEGRKRLIHNGDLHIRVVSPTLSGIDLQGAGNVQLNGEIKSESMTINMNGAGAIDAERIICGQLTADVNGAGAITLKNVTADDISLKMNGVGSLEANFTSSGNLTCSMNGVGSMDLRGQVKSFSKKANGVGNIDADRLKVGE